MCSEYEMWSSPDSHRGKGPCLPRSQTLLHSNIPGPATQCPRPAADTHCTPNGSHLIWWPCGHPQTAAEGQKNRCIMHNGGRLVTRWKCWDGELWQDTVERVGGRNYEVATCIESITKTRLHMAVQIPVCWLQRRQYSCLVTLDENYMWTIF